jgi:uncharacterized iron-regulated membrane protein
MSDIAIASAEASHLRGTEFRAFIARLHFYIGLFVGPFILVAALTGVLFVLTPQLEEMIYAGELQARTEGAPQTLAAQAQAARRHVGEGPRLFAVRPAIAPGATTRVMFAEPGLGGSESRAVFVDPASLEIQGDLVVYGTSGTLPLRTTIDYLHRHLLLGEAGRIYSELAASWLWIATLGGVTLWFWRRPRPKPSGVSLRRLHGTIGVALAAGFLFLSITGLTWSRWAGDHIDEMRAALGWVTPSVSTELGAAKAAGGHADHHVHGSVASGESGPGDPALLLDRVQDAARKAGIDSPSVEIRPSSGPGQAWLVREYDRRWPTQVDTLAIDVNTMTVTGRADFETFPLVAKLIRWGIDAHMGILFGLPNQLVLACFGVLMIAMIVMGYGIWWQRRPRAGRMPAALVQSWRRMPAAWRWTTAGLALALGWALPALGGSLVLFLAVDAARWRLASRRKEFSVS